MDYGYIVRGMLLPDGTTRSIDHRREHPETFALLPGAIWWSPRKMPRWIEDEGAQYPTDRFTQQCILDRFADDGASGWGRPIPDWWTEPVQEVAS